MWKQIVAPLNVLKITHKNSRYLATRKRFYKRCSVLKSNGNYELALDRRKLKTPRGNLFQVDNEPLALAVAAEWDAQRENINQSSMHLTGLCSTVLDNPDQLSITSVVDELVGYIDSDTILYQTNDDGELYELQAKEWTPVSEWLCRRFDVNIVPSRNITGPKVTQADKDKLRRHFMSYSFWSIIGFRFSIEALKSVTLGLACAERFVNVEQATRLSRLEEEYQTDKWGRVEWAHDINEQDTRARVAAGMLFIQCTSSKYLVQDKRKSGLGA